MWKIKCRLKSHSQFLSEFISDHRSAPENFSIIKDIISKQVTNNDNNMLTTIPTNEEVHAASFSLDSSIAPGPGGYSGAFLSRLIQRKLDEGRLMPIMAT